MLNENVINPNNISQDKVIFTISLVSVLRRLKDNSNIDDIFLNFNLDKLEIYVFVFEENFDTEDFITKNIVEWETAQCYFPEVFINLSEQKMNLLPRKAVKVC